MSEAEFRWQAFFQRCTEPLFVLNRQQYLLFANEAFEQLAGLSSEELKRLWCARPNPPAADEDWDKVLSHLLTPPPNVLEGRPGRHRQLIPARKGNLPCWWDIDFFPLADRGGFRGLVGKVTSGPEASGPVSPPLPEKAANLRQRALELLGQTYLGGKLPAMCRLAEQVRFASRGRGSVVLVGGPGTGKKTLARLIHARSTTQEFAFAIIDCRRLPPFAVGAMLWGESGAAARAAVGTFYLNEPASLPLELQERLLRWLAPTDGQGRRPRLMAGCQTDPIGAVRQGQLLDELYQALMTFRIDLPALAERLDDLPHLVTRMLQRLSAEDGKPIHTLSHDTWEDFLAYSWPGNLRELYSVLQTARRHAPHETLDSSDLPAYIRQQISLGQMPAARTDVPVPVRPLLHQVEQRMIELALRRSRGNKRKAAKLLSVDVPWLYRRLKELGLMPPSEKPEEAEEE